MDDELIATIPQIKHHEGSGIITGKTTGFCPKNCWFLVAGIVATGIEYDCAITLGSKLVRELADRAEGYEDERLPHNLECPANLGYDVDIQQIFIREP